MEPKKIVFATNNAHKLEEVRRILGPSWRVLSLADIGCHDDIPEDGHTLEDNALAKARWVAARFGCDCFADDTGLEVQALAGAPGVHSARYAALASPGTPDHDSEANMRLLLRNLQGITDRRARFRTVMALIYKGAEHSVEGIVEGSIATDPRGSDGFGYDPLFIPDGSILTFAQMSPDRKNAISHRRRASDALVALLSSLHR